MALALDVHREKLALKAPFRISGYVFEHVEVVRVTVSDGACAGRGEAAGVYNLGDRPEGMAAALEAKRAAIEEGVTRAALREMLPPGGARNALDCALWELEAQRAEKPVWQLAGLPAPRPLRTTFTISAYGPEQMARSAARFAQAGAIKLKLTGEVDLDCERVRAVRRERADVWLAVDANQGYGPDSLSRLLPVLIEARVSLLEQPYKRGYESDLDDLECAIPVAADESVQGLDEVDALAGRVDVINIKLDKCGGLTEGLLMAERARALGMQVMVGNMIGTSLAMAPAYLLGQLCDVVDLDGPMFLARDRVPGVTYRDGLIHCPDEVWGREGEG